MIIHYALYKVLGDPVRAIRGAKTVFGELVKVFEPVKPVALDRIIRVSGGEVFDLGEGVRLKVIYTPGHEVDHVAFYEESTRTLFPGEAVCLYNSKELPVFIPPCSGAMYNVEQARGSLKLLSKLNVDHICTPHFGVVEMEPSKHFNKSMEAIDYWYNEINGMLKRGMNYPEILRKCKEIILKSAGYSSINELNEFFKRYWFPVMPKLMVIGFMTLFLWRF